MLQFGLHLVLFLHGRDAFHFLSRLPRHSKKAGFHRKHCPFRIAGSRHRWESPVRSNISEVSIMKVKWGPLAFGCLLAGILETSSIEGSIFLTSVLYLLDICPQHIKGNVTFILFFGKCMELFLFFCSGLLDFYNACIFGVCCMIGSILGNHFFNMFQNRTATNNSKTITFVLICILLVNLANIPFTTYIEIITNRSVFDFKVIC